MTARTVNFFGETFSLADTVSEIAVMEFAEAASDGLDGDTMEGLAALMRLIKECIVEDERKKFMVHARKSHAGSTDLVKIIEAALGDQIDRPTERPSDSSDGPSSIAPKSAANSVDRGLEHFAGRPDLQLAVVRQRESLSA